MRIWKISHSYPGCSFVWKIRVVYFLVKHSYLCNKYGNFIYNRRIRHIQLLVWNKIDSIFYSKYKRKRSWNDSILCYWKPTQATQTTNASKMCPRMHVFVSNIVGDVGESRVEYSVPLRKNFDAMNVFMDLKILKYTWKFSLYNSKECIK